MFMADIHYIPIFRAFLKTFMVFVSLEIILQLRVDLLGCLIAVRVQANPCLISTAPKSN